MDRTMLGQSKLLEVFCWNTNHPMCQTWCALKGIQIKPTRHGGFDAQSINRDDLKVRTCTDSQQGVVRAHAFVTTTRLHFKPQVFTDKDTAFLERFGNDDQVIQFCFRHDAHHDLNFHKRTLHHAIVICR
jgi:hypothetical protein